MEDAVSLNSADSSSLIGDEFVVVHGNEPRLRVANGDAGDLVKKMTEVLNDESNLTEGTDDNSPSTKPGQCSQREEVPLLKTPLGGQRAIANVTNDKNTTDNELISKYMFLILNNMKHLVHKFQSPTPNTSINTTQASTIQKYQYITPHNHQHHASINM